MFFDAKAAAGQHEALTEVLGCAAKAGLPTFDTFAAFENENVGRDIDTYYTMMHLPIAAAPLLHARSLRRSPPLESEA